MAPKTVTSTTDSEPVRVPLGHRRDSPQVDHTVLRVVGDNSTPALDVAAFNSFAD